jgi:predicted nucleic acid-binding Zn ribbon protein
MRRLLPFILFLCFFTELQAQFGIGTREPNVSAQLDVVSKNRGVLIPRVELTGLSDQKTIENGNVDGLMVYNITDNSSIKPGFYYWNNGFWNRILSESIADDTVVFYDKEERSIYYLNDSGEKIFITSLSGNNIYTGNGAPVAGSVRGMSVGDLYVDVAGGRLYTYTSANVWSEIAGFGRSDEEEEEELTLDEIFEKYEKVSTLVNNGDGTYTYTNEKKAETEITVVGDVVENFEGILSSDIVKNLLSRFVRQDAVENLTFDGSGFYYVDARGERKTLDISEIVKKNETISTLEKDATQPIYSYTNESGKVTEIDVLEDVVTNFEDILVKQNVQELLVNFVKEDAKENLTFDGTEFFYVDATGKKVSLDISQIVTQNETISTMEKDATQGFYIYQDESGEETIIDIKGDVINQFGNIINDQQVIKEIQKYLSGNRSTLIESGFGIVVRGDGTENTPYVISRTEDSPVVVYAFMPNNFDVPTGSGGIRIQGFQTPTTLLPSNNTSWNGTDGTFTVDRTGVYSINATLTFDSGTWNTNSSASIRILVNNTPVAESIVFVPPFPSTTIQRITIPTVHAVVRLSQNETVAFRVIQDSGTTKSLLRPTSNLPSVNTIKIREIR